MNEICWYGYFKVFVVWLPLKTIHSRFLPPSSLRFQWIRDSINWKSTVKVYKGFKGLIAAPLRVLYIGAQITLINTKPHITYFKVACVCILRGHFQSIL
jgi:hypothetical protein